MTAAGQKFGWVGGTAFMADSWPCLPASIHISPPSPLHCCDIAITLTALSFAREFVEVKLVSPLLLAGTDVLLLVLLGLEGALEFASTSLRIASSSDETSMLRSRHRLCN